MKDFFLRLFFGSRPTRPRYPSARDCNRIADWMYSRAVLRETLADELHSSSQDGPAGPRIMENQARWLEDDWALEFARIGEEDGITLAGATWIGLRLAVVRLAQANHGEGLRILNRTTFAFPQERL